MLNYILFPLLCAATLAAVNFTTEQVIPPADTLELSKIDPSKALDLIRRIKIASGDVAS